MKACSKRKNHFRMTNVDENGFCNESKCTWIKISIPSVPHRVPATSGRNRKKSFLGFAASINNIRITIINLVVAVWQPYICMSNYDAILPETHIVSIVNGDTDTFSFKRFHTDVTGFSHSELNIHIFETWSERFIKMGLFTYSNRIPNLSKKKNIKWNR